MYTCQNSFIIDPALVTAIGVVVIAALVLIMIFVLGHRTARQTEAILDIEKHLEESTEKSTSAPADDENMDKTEEVPAASKYNTGRSGKTYSKEELEKLIRE